MLYYTLKIIHILSAVLVVTSMTYSCVLWRKGGDVVQRIQIQTWSVIIPGALLQLLTGFTIISLQHEDIAQLWIKGSVIGFIILMGSWMGFVYFLVSEAARRLQSFLLTLCGATLLTMLFLMANKI